MDDLLRASRQPTTLLLSSVLLMDGTSGRVGGGILGKILVALPQSCQTNAHAVSVRLRPSAPLLLAGVPVWASAPLLRFTQTLVCLSAASSAPGGLFSGALTGRRPTRLRLRLRLHLLVVTRLRTTMRSK